MSSKAIFLFQYIFINQYKKHDHVDLLNKNSLEASIKFRIYILMNYLFIRPIKEHIYNQFEFLRIFRIHAVSLTSSWLLARRFVTCSWSSSPDLVATQFATAESSRIYFFYLFPNNFGLDLVRSFGVKWLNHPTLTLWHLRW